MIASPPPPNAAIPTAPAAIVRTLAETKQQLNAAMDGWDKSSPAPRRVVLLALYEQRVIRFVATKPRVMRRVVHADPALEDDLVARSELTRLSLSTPLPPAPPRLGRAAPASRLVRWYREGERRFRIRWQLLAAINFVESAFNRIRNTSGAGARGPMQFEPATWKAYGLGGDIDDPHDAIIGAANYLAASGGRRNPREALFEYNHSKLYVDAVMRYAHQMRIDRHAFFAYYNWQVYFRTAGGYRRVTGPR